MNPEVARPEWMVLTAIARPPVTVRPSITLESGDGRRTTNSQTRRRLANQSAARENRDAGAPNSSSKISGSSSSTNHHLLRQPDVGIPLRGTIRRPLKTLVQRLKGKGPVRSNLSGKRVNFSARTVISPDPILSINEVGVPIEAARELTVPVHVQAYNVEIVKQWDETRAAPLDRWRIRAG